LSDIITYDVENKSLPSGLFGDLSPTSLQRS
jgi:hypothetical protein